MTSRTWSPQQTAIFEWFKSPATNLVVRARAGTGKTTTIVEAIRHIGATPYSNGAPNPAADLRDPTTLMVEPRILLCAFNKRVQQELMARIPDDSRVDVKTLHALGFMFLKGAWGELKLDNDVDDDRVRAAVGDGVPWQAGSAIKKLAGIAKGAAPFGGLDDLIDLAVLHGCEVEEYLHFDVGRIASAAYAIMEASKVCDETGRITFDDMLYVPVVNGYAIPLYDWVIVDEAQDMNASQLLLAVKACKPDGHVVVVGDDRQAIYGFRGADSNALDRLKTALAADELGLTTTYRCPQRVVVVAQRLVPDLAAAPGAPDGCVDTIQPGEILDNVLPGDVILSRTNAPLVPLCLGLIRRNVAARIEGRDVGKQLADRARRLKATSVEDFLQKLSRWGKRARMNAVALGRCLEQKLQEIADIEETLVALADGCDTVAQVLARCESMFGDSPSGMTNVGFATTMLRPTPPRPAQHVVLSSVHKAKGLEWPRVFLLAETLYCYGKRRDREEENIHYVAVTRAKDTLVMVGRVKVPA